MGIDGEPFDIDAFLNELWDADHEPATQGWDAHVLDRLHEASVLLDEQGYNELAAAVGELYQRVGRELTAEHSRK